jgi:hypothetical protein
MMSRDVLWKRATARECCVQPLHTPTPWMPDQVGHDSFEVVGYDSFLVIPAKAGIHARKPRLPFHAWHDGQRDTA